MRTLFPYTTLFRSDGAAQQVRPVPEGYGTITPWIISRDTARLLDFVKAAFGATEIARIYNEDGSIGHAECRIGDSMVMAFDAKAEWPDTPAFLRLYFADGDVIYQRALAAGAKAVTEMTELAFGDRVGRVRDPLGNIWWLQTRVAELTPEEMGQRASQERYSTAMRYVQNARFFPGTEPAER